MQTKLARLIATHRSRNGDITDADIVAALPLAEYLLLNGVEVRHVLTENVAEALHNAQGFDDWDVAGEDEREWSYSLADAAINAGVSSNPAWEWEYRPGTFIRGEAFAQAPVISAEYLPTYLQEGGHVIRRRVTAYEQVVS